MRTPLEQFEVNRQIERLHDLFVEACTTDPIMMDQRKAHREFVYWFDRAAQYITIPDQEHIDYYFGILEDAFLAVQLITPPSPMFEYHERHLFRALDALFVDLE